MTHAPLSALCLATAFALALAAPAAHAQPGSTNGSVGNGTADRIGIVVEPYHCVEHHPHHCNTKISVELPSDAGELFVEFNVSNLNMSGGVWEVSANGTLLVNVSYVAGANATASVNATLSIENASRIIFPEPRNLTLEVLAGGTTSHMFAFLVKDTPDQLPLAPRFLYGVEDLQVWNETWVPLVHADEWPPASPPTPTPTPTPTPSPTPTATATPSPPPTPTSLPPTATPPGDGQTPLGPLALAALAAAAVLALPRRARR